MGKMVKFRVLRFPIVLALATITASLSGTIYGCMITWTSPVMDSLISGKGITTPFPVSLTEFSWISGISPLTAVFGAITTAFLSDAVGRKMSMVVSTIPNIAGWLVVVFSKSVTELYVGRALIGFAVGMHTFAGPLYIFEIAPIRLKKTFSLIFGSFIGIGVLFTAIVGFFFSTRYLSLACAVVPLVMGAMMLLMPETPYYFLRAGNGPAARASLLRLRRADHDNDSELFNIIASINESSANSLPTELAKHEVKKGLVITVAVMVLAHMCGIDFNNSYSNHIFRSTGEPDSGMSTIISSAFCPLGTFIGMILINIIGRRTLILASSAISTISNACLGIYFSLLGVGYLPHYTSLNQWLVLAFMCTFMMGYSIGLMSIPWVIMGQVFSPGVRGPASLFGYLIHWIFSFLVTFGSIRVMHSNGVVFVFWALFIAGAVGVAYVYFLSLKLRENLPSNKV